MNVKGARIELTELPDAYELQLLDDSREVIAVEIIHHNVLYDLFIEAGERLFANDTKKVDLIYDLVSRGKRRKWKPLPLADRVNIDQEGGGEND